MIDIGSSKKEVRSIKEILDKKNRSEAGQAAPAKGLILEKIYY
jgi:tRNA U38,U39,U40 pseudouridine synthase TruA